MGNVVTRVTDAREDIKKVLPFVGTGVPIGSLLNLSARGNTVGLKAVTPQTYDTNSGSTWKTVGATGADYTSLRAAYTAASAGAVIEIIDDEITLDGTLISGKALDGNGKAIKIKGKATKTIVNLYGTGNPLYSTGANSAIEFENITFVSAATQAIYSVEANNNGFWHFINCKFKFATGYIYLWSSKETVFDGCDFTECGGTGIITNKFGNTINALARLIVNNCTVNNASADTFILTTNAGSGTYNSVSLTNNSIQIKDSQYISFYRDYKTVDIRGNNSKTSIYVGLEMQGSAITGYLDYVAETAYVIGNRITYLSNLWECIQDTTGNAPSYTSAYWKRADFITGTIENNLIAKETLSGTKHGLFVGFGCSGFSIKNNIVHNFSYNYVVKGYNNTIEYNCAGYGLHGFSIFANDQLSFRNNTSRGNDGAGLQIAPQATAGTGLTETDYLYNILVNDVTGKKAIDDIYSRYDPVPQFNNIYLGNRYYGPNIQIAWQGLAINLQTNFSDFKTAVGDIESEYVDPEFVGSDPMVSDFYKPGNLAFKQKMDNLNQAIGAVDYK